MKQALQAFFKRPTTMIGIATALLFQLIFSVVWMTGYSGISDRTENLTIGVVNEDKALGSTIFENLKQSLPVQVEEVAELSSAETLLDERKLQMIVHIPADFSAKVTGGEGTAVLNYTINESNPQMIKTMMSGMAAQITSTVNKQAVASGAANVLGGLNMPQEQASAIGAALSERVVSNIQSTNPVKGINNQMVPMMMVLASYVGAMIMAQNLHLSSLAVRAQSGRWQVFGARVIINVAAAAVVSLAGSAFVLSLGGQSAHGFLALWGFQALFVLTFMFVAQMFLVIFGMAGMLFNIVTLSAQLVSSGAMMPREMLSDFYQGLSSIFPATYAVEGSMNILFGGPDVVHAALGLLSVLAAAVAVSALATALRKGDTGALAGVPASRPAQS
ncbi:YhgE/Pip domain-containing protein [Paenibacillus tarimensis]|uniref:YhgE/Pip domain-containing protein n=1 Tax=Paenibacillus tarimensis TaxID=416012 RepID=UPI001F47712F|nr:ABC transporter permease [Paenibacillus tarimensis]MCF2945938.1 ABC transporter permease [Paenibacillus tarimensis]